MGVLQSAFSFYQKFRTVQQSRFSIAITSINSCFTNLRQIQEQATQQPRKPKSDMRSFIRVYATVVLSAQNFEARRSVAERSS